MHFKSANFCLSKAYSVEKTHFWHVNVYNRPEHTAKGDPKELNFEGLEMQK